MSDENQQQAKRTHHGGVVTGVGRAIVSLMWGILLAVVVFVAYLATRFYG